MSNLSVAVRGDCVGLRAAPTRKNSQVISELAGRVTRHCRALAMHGMHVAGDGSQSCSCQDAAVLAQHGSRGSGTLSAVSDLHSAKAFWQSLSPPVANQGHKTSPLRFRITSFPLLEVGLFTYGQIVQTTMAANLHRKAIPVN